MRPSTARVGAFDLVIAAGGLILLLLAVQNLGPALAAFRGDGAWGTFTAHRVECVQHPGHEQCTWLGEFRAGRTVRPEVAFYGGERGSFTPGQAARAFDTGRRGHVYGPGGSNEWIAVALLMLAGLGLASRPLWRLRRLRRARRPAGEPGAGPRTDAGSPTDAGPRTDADP
ncbi:hypothetical protein [Streptosporangium sandarakinum]